ncbi:DUF3726 domain-containing protein [Ruegeria sp. 2205SS24-7]|uniref:DUF3726 domain-containing protein n=1 Tax=Ruegeria discodermiae TaxID=3064389 RepID=UPI002741F605|nr:DUF3726 domain-containing protein [Ruegeria sp. 2205SS24-7]MDP5216655.1 DUF3726 domain-containing protein [Ruegeria sp. 2205SS24-7]
MTLSLNEMEATAKRATRGGLYSWGLAEEAAKATRWLCAHGLDGGAVLAALLQRRFAASLQDHTPENLDEPWQCKTTLCPLTAGVTLSDCAERLSQRPTDMRQVAHPLLILPFAAQVARKLERSVTVTSGSWEAVTDGTALSMPQEAPDHSEHLRIELGGVLSELRPHRTRATPAPETRAILSRFAQLTYAPATEESRRLGAGAGLSDND